MITTFRRWFWLMLLLGGTAPMVVHAEPEALQIGVSSGDDISFQRFPADGDHLIIQFAPEYGLRPNHRRFAELLTTQGIEVWLGNLQESLFLPDSASTIRQLDTSVVAELVDVACDRGKQVLLAGDAYGAIVALRGAHDWQRLGQKDCLLGAILFSPYAYRRVPALGEEPRYLPVIDATSVPLLIYQANGSATRGRFEQLLTALRQHGNPVYTGMMPDIMSLFYEEPPSPVMVNEAARVARLIARSLPLLGTHPVPREPVADINPVDDPSGIDIALRPFTAGLTALPIDLTDTDNNRFVRQDYTGRVTLINFWATWCPPCVEEIPSLNELQQTLGNEDFELISINYAEPIDQIRAFMRQVDVDFPVLLDPDGEFSRLWRVVAFPSSFIIGPDGRIRYGVNAAIDWADPEVVRAIRALAPE